MNRNEYYKSTYGYKAEVIKDLYQDKDFSDLIPKTIFISDMVFYKFLLEDNEVYSKCLTWFKASLNNTGEEEDDTFEELQKLIRERYVPFMKREIPNLEERIEKEFGKGKKVIVRSSGIEDLAESINAGGNRSIPEVEPKDIYGAIMEVVLSYFSPKVLKILHITTIDQMVDPFEFQCPVFIQEMVGSTNWVLDTELYPRIETNTLVSIANKVLQLKEKFGRDIDTEWVLKADNVAVSIVAFSRDPYYGSECVYMLCSLGVGSAVRRTAIVNATHYIIPCIGGCLDSTLLLEYPEKKTTPFELGESEQWLVQCRPAGVISLEVQVNDTIKDGIPEKFQVKIKPYFFTSIVIGKGDVDGRFIISESISEAWEEYIRIPEREKYVGCIVRHGSALEHAGIMFAEKRMPVIEVKDNVFALLATKHDASFALCLSLGVFFEMDKGMKFSYSYCPNVQIPIHFENAQVRLLTPHIKQESEQNESDDGYALWASINELLNISENIIENGKIQEKNICERLQSVVKKALSLSDAPLKSGLQVYIHMIDLLIKVSMNIQTLLFWSRIADRYIHGEIGYQYGSSERNVIECALAAIKKRMNICGTEKKIAFMRAYAQNPLQADENDVGKVVLFSMSQEEAQKLPDDLKDEYKAYYAFLKQYGCANDLMTVHFYSIYCSRELREEERLVLSLLFEETRDFETAVLFINMVTTNTTIGGGAIRGKIQEFVLNMEYGNIVERILAAQIILEYGGLGDLDSLLGEATQAVHGFVRVLAKLHLCKLCKKLYQIFQNHQRGILDQCVAELSKVRESLRIDLDILLALEVKRGSTVYYVLSNIITNLTSTIIDLFDIEGKSYANSLALDISCIYSKYVTHLSQWNQFLRNKLLLENSEYGEIADIVDQKIAGLRKKRNNHISIELDNMWYEKMTMPLDFNPHELQNILHQASIYFADRKNTFYPSDFVNKIHKSLITFGLTNRRLLRNQSDYVEVEVGLGNYKLHKSSIIIRAGSISAVYTEAPLLSIGRLLVLQQIFQTLADMYPKYHISTRLQQRTRDHLLFVYMNTSCGEYSFDELAFGVNIISSMFDAFELGGGIADRSAYYFNKTFCSSSQFTEFLVKMVEYHDRLIYSDNMGGGMEDNDVCIYQSLIALMVIFPERFHVLTDAKNFLEMVEMINGDLKKKEWKTDRYNLSRGWLERALCMCLAIAYPAQLRNALSSQERKKLPNPLFCELYLTIVNGSKDL